MQAAKKAHRELLIVEDGLVCDALAHVADVQGDVGHKVVVQHLQASMYMSA